MKLDLLLPPAGYVTFWQFWYKNRICLLLLFVPLSLGSTQMDCVCNDNDELYVWWIFYYFKSLFRRQQPSVFNIVHSGSEKWFASDIPCLFKLLICCKTEFTKVFAELLKVQWLKSQTCVIAMSGRQKNTENKAHTNIIIIILQIF